MSPKKSIAERIKELMNLKKDDLLNIAKELKLAISKSKTKLEIASKLVKDVSKRQIDEARKRLEKQAKKSKPTKPKTTTKSQKRMLAPSTLMKKRRDELLKLAREHGIKVKRGATKAEIVEALTGKPVASKRKPSKSKPTTTPPKPHPPESKPSYKEEVESSRFSVAREETAPPVQEEPPFPQWEGQTILLLLPRDQSWLFATWEIDLKTKERILAGRKAEAFVLRIYDYGVRGVQTEPTFIDIQISEDTDNWFINTGKPDHVFEAEIGYIINGKFEPIVRSNRAYTAPASESNLEAPYFVRIPTEVSLPELRKRLEALGIKDERIALHLHRLGFAPPLPSMFPLTEEDFKAIAKRLREALQRGEMPTSQ